MKLNRIFRKKKVLEYFLKRDITETEEILNIFGNMKGAVRGKALTGYPYVFIPGKSDNKVLLVAHCDTVWEGKNCNQKLKYKHGIYYSGKNNVGIGADDRAGLAMLYLLRKSGHSLLITTGEEKGMKCANYLSEEEYKMINEHNFIIQLDKCGSEEFKCYHVGSEEFIDYIKERTGFNYIKPFSYTDVVALCKTICGVNMSVGYYNEHTPKECLVYKDWLKTLDATKDLIKDSKRFELDKKKGLGAYEEKEDNDYFDEKELKQFIESLKQDKSEEVKTSEDDNPEISL